MGSCSPFGLQHEGYNDATSSIGNSIAQKFGLNGKELEESLGLNLHEMDMRQYDTTIARWTSIDPVTHYDLSTYNAFDNNPVYWADPSGADSESFDEYWNTQISIDETLNNNGFDFNVVISTSLGANSTPFQDSKAAKARKKYLEMIEKARARGAVVAAANLEHWLNGSGTQRNLSADWLRSFAAIKLAEKVNIKRFEQQLEKLARGLSDGESATLNDYWDKGLYADYNTELYFASGGSTLTSTGNFEVSRKGNQIFITGTINHKWKDDYDWHKGLTAKIPGFGNIEDSDALLVEEEYGAKPFKMRGNWQKSIKVSATINDTWYGSKDLTIKLN